MRRVSSKSTPIVPLNGLRAQSLNGNQDANLSQRETHYIQRQQKYGFETLATPLMLKALAQLRGIKQSGIGSLHLRQNATPAVHFPR
jgi:hypothetical protein